MYNKILNPETNRKVSIFSKKGKEILMNFIEFLHSFILLMLSFDNDLILSE